MSSGKRFECLMENSRKSIQEKKPKNEKNDFKKSDTSNKRFSLNMFNTDEEKKNNFTSGNFTSGNFTSGKFNNKGNYRKYDNYNSFSRTLKKSKHVEKKEKPFEYKNEEFPSLGSN